MIKVKVATNCRDVKLFQREHSAAMVYVIPFQHAVMQTEEGEKEVFKPHVFQKNDSIQVGKLGKAYFIGTKKNLEMFFTAMGVQPKA